MAATGTGRGLLARLEGVARAEVPVIVKEVGSGHFRPPGETAL